MAPKLRLEIKPRKPGMILKLLITFLCTFRPCFPPSSSPFLTALPNCLLIIHRRTHSSSTSHSHDSLDYPKLITIPIHTAALKLDCHKLLVTHALCLRNYLKYSNPNCISYPPLNCLNLLIHSLFTELPLFSYQKPLVLSSLYN